jgi:hypothetical protein
MSEARCDTRIAPAARDRLLEAIAQRRALEAELVERRKIVSAAAAQVEVAEGGVEAAVAALEEARSSNRERQLASLRNGNHLVPALFSIAKKEQAITDARERMQLAEEVLEEAKARVRGLEVELERAAAVVKDRVADVIAAAPELARYFAAMREFRIGVELTSMLGRAGYRIVHQISGVQDTRTQMLYLRVLEWARRLEDDGDAALLPESLAEAA